MRKGAVGIGTLIIFIAMVLVAAIAAAVLINTSGILQQRAMTTGKESIQQVSSNIVVESVRGYTADNQGINNISVIVSAAAGAGRIDLRYLIIRIRNDVNESYLNYTSGSLSARNFTAEELRDPTNVFSTSSPVIDGSALVVLRFLVGSTSSPPVHLVPRSKFYMDLMPEHGTAVSIATQLPESFSSSVIDIYP